MRKWMLKKKPRNLDRDLGISVFYIATMFSLIPRLSGSRRGGGGGGDENLKGLGMRLPQCYANHIIMENWLTYPVRLQVVSTRNLLHLN